MSSLSRKIWRIHITGVVQSVGFRPFIKNLGDEASLKGYVSNLGDAGVEIVINSSDAKKDKFISCITDQLPELAMITEIIETQIDDQIDFSTEFEIKQSKPSTSNSSGFSALPPDISICSFCKDDISNQQRRIDYPFTSCTDCGPRYATIIGLPYDRPLTSFSDFPLCEDCMTEYKFPANRRFHAQTTCCEVCGPNFEMYKWNEEWVHMPFSWEKVVSSLRQGKILSVMGLSGTHFVLDALNREVISSFRKMRRKQSDKPFAVMMESLNDVMEYCEVTDNDIKLLQSSRKPIVILPVKDPILWDKVSPGINSLGVMLPYSGFHYLLFSKGAPKVLIMTSANQPGIPMPIIANDVLESSVSISNIVLVHNRKIIQRNDDSVIRSHGDYHQIIRRSRGYTPQPFYVEQLKKHRQIVAFGSEENNTITYQKAGWILPSQHMGHIINLETQDFQKSTCDHLEKLFSFTPEVVLTDLHPEFLSTISAMNYSSDREIPIYAVQHHVAHVASLALDWGIGHDEPILAWVGDGFGYGNDGQAWGGELISIHDGNWDRVSSLIGIDYHGGDQNAKYPGRMLLNYLKTIGMPLDALSDNANRYFRHGEKEFEYLESRILNKKLITTSMGRFLDSFAVLLDICDRRTYRGEPAIKLEGLASIGNETIDVYPLVSQQGNMMVVDNTSILKTGIEHLETNLPADVALWVHKTLATSMGVISGKFAEKEGIKNVGFTGGVAYNQLITENYRDELMKFNIELLTHKNVPPGDGGISIGQIYYYGELQNE
ncbi:MAG: carbamoyltransferase HypF [Candidatus Heimdallarchaeota archaeon]|nr:carbamoyltransferase HypF [Candidatus Heimdallarchaeota archaeon]